ncbi:hypothetical protein MRB53_040724 [Persea americana]|nr:hypothetical protein MRB53_040724 [Persea americana]
MADHEYEFNVKMTCGGCSGAVERVLKKLDGMLWALAFRMLLSDLRLGVKSFDVSLPEQTAKVTASPELSYDSVLATIKKTGKQVTAGKADGVSKDV